MRVVASSNRLRITPLRGLACGLLLLIGIAAVTWKPALLAWRLREARHALAHHRSARALTLLYANRRLAGKHAETEFWLARANRKLGRFDRVREHLLKARQLGYPLNPLEREQWLTLAQAGQMAEAGPHLQELLLSPGDDGREICEAYFQGYCQNLQFEMASILLDAWKAEYPKDAEQYFRRGYLRQSLMDAPGAIENYRRGLEIDPDRPDARLRLAQSLLQMNWRDEAEQELRRLLKELPEDVEVKVGLARCLKQKGDFAEARRLLTAVVQDNPQHVDARLEIGTLAAKQRAYTEAIQWLEPVYQARPYDTSTLLALGQAHQGLGHPALAQEFFDRLEVADKLEKQLDKSISEAIRTPNDPDVRLEVGRILLQTGARGEAVKWLRSVLELDPKHVAAHRELARCFDEAGKTSLAQQHLTAAEAIESLDE